MSLKNLDSSEWVEAALGVATSRLCVIEAGREIGSVAEVCRREGISKQTYYRWKRRYEAAGLRGLQDRPIPPSPGRPRRTTGSLALMILDHVKKHPREGCVALSKRLAAVEVRVSSPTIQKALIRWGLGSQQARMDWVQAGCLPVESRVNALEEWVPTAASLARARAFFFCGIPRQAKRNLEPQSSPSLAQVAKVTGVNLNHLKAIAARQNWEDARARYLIQIANSNLQTRWTRARSAFDTEVLTSTALALSQVIQHVKSTGNMRPIEMLRCMSVLKKGYRALKAIFGGQLPPTLGGSWGSTPGDTHEKPRVCISNSGTEAESGSLSAISTQTAKALFFRGIPGEGHAQGIPSPSVRQVAERLSLPLRALQRCATKQEWVAARREVDRQGDSYRIDRILSVIGPFWATQMVEQIHITVRAVTRKAHPFLRPEMKTTTQDLTRCIEIVGKGLQLTKEILRDLQDAGRGKQIPPRRIRKAAAPRPDWPVVSGLRSHD